MKKDTLKNIFKYSKISNPIIILYLFDFICWVYSFYCELCNNSNAVSKIYTLKYQKEVGNWITIISYCTFYIVLHHSKFTRKSLRN